MAAPLQRDLGARDRAQTEMLRGMGELQRSVDAIVVGERERVVPKLHGPRCELLRQRGTVEKRVSRMGMKLDISLLTHAGVNHVCVSPSR